MELTYTGAAWHSGHIKDGPIKDFSIPASIHSAMGKWWDPTSAMKVTTILKTAMVIVMAVTCNAASFTVPAEAEARCLA